MRLMFELLHTVMTHRTLAGTFLCLVHRVSVSVLPVGLTARLFCLLLCFAMLIPLLQVLSSIDM